MPVVNDPDTLADPFAKKIRLMQERLERDGLPFVLFETRRPFSRQRGLFLQGRVLKNGRFVKVGKTVTNADAGQSPHQWGLAADFVLDVKSAWWGGQKPTGAWDTGSNDRPLPKLAWEKLGRVAKETGLIWGGSWATFKDLPHVEMPEWRAYRPKDWQSHVEKEILAGH